MGRSEVRKQLVLSTTPAVSASCEVVRSSQLFPLGLFLALQYLFSSSSSPSLCPVFTESQRRLLPCLTVLLLCFAFGLAAKGHCIYRDPSRCSWPSVFHASWFSTFLLTVALSVRVSDPILWVPFRRYILEYLLSQRTASWVSVLLRCPHCDDQILFCETHDFLR